MRLTLSQAKSSRIPVVLGMCSSDSRFVAYLNEAMERLLHKGKWVGTYGRYHFCVEDGCITWPRQLATIEGVAVCDGPVQIRNEWFEFIENGPGLIKECTSGSCITCGGLMLVDRGYYPTFKDVTGTTKKIRIYPDLTADVGKRILLQGLDENGNQIRTLDGTTYVDGEYVTLAMPSVTSTKFFSALTGVQKPETNGVIRLYSFNTTNSTQEAIAVYEPDELVPMYRRSFISGLPEPSDDCDTINVQVIAKHAFIQVKNDTDYLAVPNLAALKEMCMSLKKAEDNLFQEAEMYEGRAIRELERQLEHHLGDAAMPTLNIKNASFVGAPVENLV